METLFKINLIELETMYMNSFKSTASYTMHTITLFMGVCLLGSCFSSTVYKAYASLLPFYRVTVIAYLTFGLLLEGVEHALAINGKSLEDILQKVVIAFGLPILFAWGFIECFVSKKRMQRVNLSTTARDIQFFGLIIVTILFSISFIPYEWSVLLVSQALTAKLGYFGSFISSFSSFITFCATSIGSVSYLGTLFKIFYNVIFRLLFIFVSNGIISLIYEILYPIRKNARRFIFMKNKS